MMMMMTGWCRAFTAADAACLTAFSHHGSRGAALLRLRIPHRPQEAMNDPAHFVSHHQLVRLLQEIIPYILLHHQHGIIYVAHTYRANSIIIRVRAGATGIIYFITGF